MDDRAPSRKRKREKHRRKGKSFDEERKLKERAFEAQRRLDEAKEQPKPSGSAKKTNKSSQGLAKSSNFLDKVRVFFTIYFGFEQKSQGFGIQN